MAVFSQVMLVFGGIFPKMDGFGRCISCFKPWAILGYPWSVFFSRAGWGGRPSGAVWWCHPLLGSRKLFSVEADRCLEPQGQPFINGCFNGMIANLYIENGCFTKHPFINGCLGFQVVVVRQLWLEHLSIWGMRSQKIGVFPGRRPKFCANIRKTILV